MTRKSQQLRPSSQALLGSMLTHPRAAHANRCSRIEADKYVVVPGSVQFTEIVKLERRRRIAVKRSASASGGNISGTKHLFERSKLLFFKARTQAAYVAGSRRSLCTCMTRMHSPASAYRRTRPGYMGGSIHTLGMVTKEAYAQLSYSPPAQQSDEEPVLTPLSGT